MKRAEPGAAKEREIKIAIESYEKQNKAVCPSEQKKAFEKLYSNEIMPRVYGDKK